MLAELAVPLLAGAAAVVMAGMDDQAKVPTFMILGCLSLIFALLVASGSVSVGPQVVQALAFVAAGLALFGHVRGGRR
ncbi:MAG: hypothetical protein RMK64_06940 [Rhodovarius sp.]|nr:hypothetical protein [Rhodovarius sp.]MDW8314689.1 hypothetical protein [Rhodovarius sp.]